MGQKHFFFFCNYLKNAVFRQKTEDIGLDRFFGKFPC